MDNVKLEFARGSTSAEELQGTVASILAEGEVTGIDAVRVAEGQGGDPLTVTIIVTIATRLGAHVAQKAWDEILWPKIRRRLADDALGDREK